MSHVCTGQRKVWELGCTGSLDVVLVNLWRAFTAQVERGGLPLPF